MNNYDFIEKIRSIKNVKSAEYDGFTRLLTIVFDRPFEIFINGTIGVNKTPDILQQYLPKDLCGYYPFEFINSVERKSAFIDEESAIMKRLAQ